MQPTPCIKGSCLEFVVTPLLQRAKKSLQPLANPPYMPVKGLVGSFNYAWFTNRKTETQMVKNEAESGIFPEPPGMSDSGHCLPGRHNLHPVTFPG